MNDETYSERLPRESAGWRSLRDTWAFIGTRFHGIVFLFATAIMASLVWLFALDARFQAVSPVVAFVTVISARFTFAACRAPFAQRNEAREEVKRLKELRRPKLTIGGAVVHYSLHGIFYGNAISETVRIGVANKSDVTAREVQARLLDLKSSMKWLPYHEEDRSAWTGSPDLEGYVDIPFPVPLQWSAQETSQEIPSTSIPTGERALFDVCYYESDPNTNISGLSVAFASEDKRLAYKLPEMEIILLVRIDSENCVPIYCVCKYEPNAPIGDRSDQPEILYRGIERPDLNNYRQFKETLRPAHWD